MGSSTLQMSGGEVWRLASRQHGVVARRQLLELGFSAQAIQHRIDKGRLHPVGRGVYAVGRPEVERRGRWMAAVLACGPRAALSDGSAAALWGIERERRDSIEVSVPVSSLPCRRGILVHRRNLTESDLTVKDGIPATSVVRTLMDIASGLSPAALERAVNEADRLDLVDPEALLDALDLNPGARDHERDQAHAAAGMTPLRFTHAQARFSSEHVCATLAAVVRRLEDAGSRSEPAA